MSLQSLKVPSSWSLTVRQCLGCFEGSHFHSSIKPAESSGSPPPVCMVTGSRRRSCSGGLRSYSSHHFHNELNASGRFVLFTCRLQTDQLVPVQSCMFPLLQPHGAPAVISLDLLLLLPNPSHEFKTHLPASLCSLNHLPIQHSVLPSVLMMFSHRPTSDTCTAHT